MVYHEPVMLSETLEGLNIRPGGTYVDVTFGGGGHSKAILQKLGDGKLLGFDQDTEAQANIFHDPRFTFVRSNFRFIKNFLRFHGITKVDGILADLGVSSHHFDEAERGFSFRLNGPLDMRMNQKSALTAEKILQNYTPQKLEEVFIDYGEFNRNEAKRIVTAIHQARLKGNFTTTNEIVLATERLAPRNKENKFLARIFQALRIEVNQELEALKKFLLQVPEILAPEGRLVVLTYHSLEDKLVKNFMKAGNFSGEIEKDIFGNIIAPLRQLNRGVIIASETETLKNNRARSAKLRIAEKNVTNG